MVRRLGPFGSSRRSPAAFVGDPTAVLVYPPRWERGCPDGRNPIQSLVAILGPLSVHVRGYVWIHVRGSPWTPWRSTPKGVAKGRVEGAGGPLYLRSEATRGSAGHSRGSGRHSATGWTTYPSVVVPMRFRGGNEVSGSDKNSDKETEDDSEESQNRPDDRLRFLESLPW